MSITSVHLAKPVRHRQPLIPRDHARRDRALELFESGEHGAAAREALGYLLPEHQVPDITTTPFCFTQGTARVRVRVEAGDLELSSVIAAVRPDSNLAAALRYCLTQLSSTGQMFQPRLRDGTITLEYREALSRVHPQKLIEVLQKLPPEASNHDTWLVEQFAVDLPDREPTTPLDDAELARAEHIWKSHWATVEELVTESRRRRSVPLLNLLGSFAYNHIMYALPIHGSLRMRLKEAAEEFNDRDESANKRDAALGKCVKAMRQVGAEELRANLGHATLAINPLAEGTPAVLASVLGNPQRIEATGKLRAAGRPLEAALEWIAIYVYLFAEYVWPPSIEAVLRNGLDAASDVPWGEAADALARHARETVKEFAGAKDGERDAGGEGYYDDE